MEARREYGTRGRKQGMNRVEEELKSGSEQRK